MRRDRVRRRRSNNHSSSSMAERVPRERLLPPPATPPADRIPPPRRAPCRMRWLRRGPSFDGLLRTTLAPSLPTQSNLVRRFPSTAPTRRPSPPSGSKRRPARSGLQPPRLAQGQDQTQDASAPTLARQAAQVHLSRDSAPTDRTYWLIVARNQETGEIKYFPSSAPRAPPSKRSWTWPLPAPTSSTCSASLISPKERGWCGSGNVGSSRGVRRVAG